MLALVAAILLTLAVAGGAVLAVRNLRRRPVPVALGLIHAGTAVAGIALLCIAVAVEDHPVAVNAALFLFAIALVGGVFVLLFRLQPARPPMFMVLLHGGTAAIGVVLLWSGMLAGS